MRPSEEALRRYALDDKLRAAAKQGDLAAIKQCLQEGASVKSTDQYGQTPLYLASLHNHQKAVEYLATEGEAAVNEGTPGCWSGRNSPSLRITCLRGGHIGIVRFLLRRGAIVDGADDGG